MKTGHIDFSEPKDSRDIDAAPNPVRRPNYLLTAENEVRAIAGEYGANYRITGIDYNASNFDGPCTRVHYVLW